MALVAVCALPPDARSQEPSIYLRPGDSTAHIYHSDRSGYADAARLVIRDLDTWRRVWAILVVGQLDSASPPAIDFRREVLVLAAMGARPSAGHQISIDTVRRAGLAIEAVVRSAAPGNTCMTTFAIVQPVDVVRIPRSERPILFVERQAVSACGR